MNIENNSDYCIHVSYFTCLQKISPYISPRGKVVPLGLIQQTVPWTGSTQDCVRVHTNT